jgi:hypothetical protein
MTESMNEGTQTAEEQPRTDRSTDYDQLIKEIKARRDTWNRTASRMTWLHVGLRVALIVASAVVATRDQLEPSPLGGLVVWVPILALGVTIFTTLDTWLKPGLRAQSLMRSRDDIDTLLQAEQFAKWKDPEVRGLLKGWEEILHRHRAETDIS